MKLNKIKNFLTTNKHHTLNLILILIISTIILTYQLLEIPKGLTIDESSLGYNAILLAHTGHDETGRNLPIFTLTINGSDWKQPITQYYISALFYIFNPSVFLLRFSSVIITIGSSVIIYFTSNKLFKQNKYALISSIIFLSSPLVFIHSHLATENIMPALFASLWILFLITYQKSPKIQFLIFTAISLGFGFYSYKGMRAIIPIWTILSTIYLTYLNKIQLKFPNKKIFLHLTTFIIIIFPFFAITPILEKYYAGAIFDSQQHNRPQSFIQLAYPYLSSYDLSFLYIKGDELLVHSTHRHGMFLITTLPIALYAIFKIIKNKSSIWVFILITFFTTPILYGWVGSVYRASRLLAFTPLYTLIITYGIYQFQKQTQHKKTKLLINSFTLILFSWNLYSFTQYYWTDYPKLLENQYSGLEIRHSYQTLANIAKQKQLQPYSSAKLFENNQQPAQFFELVYFNQPLIKISDPNKLPTGSIFLSERQQIDNLTKLNISIPSYFIHIKQ